MPSFHDMSHSHTEQLAERITVTETDSLLIASRANGGFGLRIGYTNAVAVVSSLTLSVHACSAGLVELRAASSLQH